MAAGETIIEGFEGPGYENVLNQKWFEAIAAGGGVVDEDASTSEAGFPYGWGNQCLKFTSLDGNKECLAGIGNMTFARKSYFHFEFVLTDLGAMWGDGNKALTLAWLFNYPAWKGAFLISAWWEVFQEELAFDFVPGSTPTGDSNWDEYVWYPIGRLGMNEKHYMDVLIDLDGNYWACRHNGVLVGEANTDWSGFWSYPKKANAWRFGHFGWGTDWYSHYIGCFDRIAISDTDWIVYNQGPYTIGKISIYDIDKVIGTPYSNINNLTGY
jgi:hypothetical protein